MLLLNAAEYEKLITAKSNELGPDYFLDARIRQSLNAKNTLTLYFPWGPQTFHKLES